MKRWADLRAAAAHDAVSGGTKLTRQALAALQQQHSPQQQPQHWSSPSSSDTERSPRQQQEGGRSKQRSSSHTPTKPVFDSRRFSLGGASCCSAVSYASSTQSASWQVVQEFYGKLLGQGHLQHVLRAWLAVAAQQAQQRLLVGAFRAAWGMALLQRALLRWSAAAQAGKRRQQVMLKAAALFLASTLQRRGLRAWLLVGAASAGMQ
jgi:hypothetical protein